MSNKANKAFLEEVCHDIQKNIEQNSEETEKSIIERIDKLEEELKKFISSSAKDSDSENEVPSLKKSMADKFDVPSLEDNILEKKLIDVITRVDSLEGLMKSSYTKLNELIKVNNAILKKMEGSGSKLHHPRAVEKP